MIPKMVNSNIFTKSGLIHIEKVIMQAVAKVIPQLRVVQEQTKQTMQQMDSDAKLLSGGRKNKKKNKKNKKKNKGRRGRK